MNGSHIAAFRGPEEGDRSATNIDAAEPAASGSPALHAVNRIERDEVLDLAIEVARTQPVAAL